MRALAEHTGDPVDLLIAGEFESMIPLLDQQPYLGAVAADHAWGMDNWIDGGGSLQQAWMPPTDTSGWGQVYHLGYRRWPELPLPYETYERVASGWTPPREELLERPWITLDGSVQYIRTLSMGWSECHFELKAGLSALLSQDEALLPWRICVPAGSRWTKELSVPPTTWAGAARVIQASKVFLGDCSALHVLAVAMGKPVVCYEPMEARWNPIFYPLGKTGRVRLVTGNDGLPTTDSRHTADALKEALSCAS
jgi:hypothetical protein